MSPQMTDVSGRFRKISNFIGNFSEIPYEIKTLREDAHAAVRKMSPYGDQRRRAKSVKLPSGMRGWGEPKSACGLCSDRDRRRVFMEAWVMACCTRKL